MPGLSCGTSDGLPEYAASFDFARSDQGIDFGSFADGENVLRTTNPALYFRMESKSDGFYEKAVWMPPATDREHTERIDIVIGGKSRANVSLLEERSLVSVVRFVLGRSGHLGE